MGWYDAFKGDTARIDMSKATSDTGSAFKNLGDAFGTIGKTMNESEIQKKKDKFLEAQSKNMDLSNTFYENSMADRLGAEQNRNRKGQEDVKLAQGLNPYKIKDAYTNTNINEINLDIAQKTKDSQIKNGNLAPVLTQTKIDDAYVNTDMNRLNLDTAQKTQEAKIKNANLAPELTQRKIDATTKKTFDPIKFNKFVRDKEATAFDKYGERIITEDNKKIIDYKATQGLKYGAMGYNENEALDLATLDYAKVLEAELKKTDPLNKKQLNTESTPQSKSPEASKSDDFLGLDI